MRLNAAIALQGLSTSELEAEDVIERIRLMLHDIDPNANVGIELLAVGADFGAPIPYHSTLMNLMTMAERIRKQLLRSFWLHGDRALLYQSQRLGHAMSSMNPARIQRILDTIDAVFY